mgnify:CR=1 FL=1
MCIRDSSPPESLVSGLYWENAKPTKASQASGDLLIQKLDSQETILIKRESIEETQTVGSPMPAGLTSVLTQSQLLDLIRYLSELGQLK